MSRRGNGEGSIYQRSDGRWAGTLDLGYVNGKRARKSCYARTRKEVANKLSAALRNQRQGLPFESERLTVEKWLVQWLESQKPPVTRPKTYTAYESQVRVHLIPAVGAKTLVKLQPEDVRILMRKKMDEGLSTKTVRHLRATPPSSSECSGE